MEVKTIKLSNIEEKLVIILSMVIPVILSSSLLSNGVNSRRTVMRWILCYDDHHSWIDLSYYCSYVCVKNSPCFTCNMITCLKYTPIVIKEYRLLSPSLSLSLLFKHSNSKIKMTYMSVLSTFTLHHITSLIDVFQRIFHK